jgi:cytoskeletal protein CcmA (bactofilin family)
MALFRKDRDRTELPQGFGAATPLPTESSTVQFLSQGSRLIGTVAFEGTVRIEGHVEGELSAGDTLIVGESAEVKAQISGTSIVVHGRVTGDITARHHLEIRAAGTVIGHVTTPSRAIHEGAVFDGRCTMGDPALKTNAELGK